MARVNVSQAGSSRCRRCSGVTTWGDSPFLWDHALSSGSVPVPWSVLWNYPAPHPYWLWMIWFFLKCLRGPSCANKISSLIFGPWNKGAETVAPATKASDLLLSSSLNLWWNLPVTLSGFVVTSFFFLNEFNFFNRYSHILSKEFKLLNKVIGIKLFIILPYLPHVCRISSSISSFIPNISHFIFILFLALLTFLLFINYYS